MQVKKNIGYIILLFLLTYVTIVYTSSTAEFFKINLDVRTAALADITVSYTYPLSSVYGNPANIVGGKGIEFAYTKWLADVYGNTVVACYSLLNERFGMGLGYSSLGTEFTNVATQDKIVYSDSLISLVLGYKFFNKINIGLSVKDYIQKLDDVSNNAVVLDFGSSFVTKKIVLSIVLKNLGTQLSETKEEIPLQLNLGGKFVILNTEEQKMNLYLEGSVFKDATIYKIATEYTYLGIFTARLGYKFNTDLDKFSLGIGTKFVIPKVKIKTVLDISYIPFGSLGEVVKFSFGIKF